MSAEKQTAPSPAYRGCCNTLSAHLYRTLGQMWRSPSLHASVLKLYLARRLPCSGLPFQSQLSSIFLRACSSSTAASFSSCGSLQDWFQIQHPCNNMWASPCTTLITISVALVWIISGQTIHCLDNLCNAPIKTETTACKQIICAT